MSNTTQVTIDLDLDSLKAQLSDAEKASAESGKKIGKGVGDGAEKGAGDYLSSLEKRLVALGTLIVGAFGFKKIIEEAANTDAAIARMNQSLNLTGSYSVEASNQMQAFADSLQKTMGIEANTSYGLIALAKSFGVSNDRAKEMTETAINLSAATGMSLDGAMRQLGATLEGQVGRLGKVSSALKDMGPVALKSGEAIDYLHSRFAGTAAAQLDTFAGAVKLAEFSFTDILKNMGELVTRSPVIIKAIAFIGKAFSDIADYFKGFQKNGVDVVGQFVVKIVDAGRAVASVLLPTLEVLFNIGKAVFDALATGVSTVATGIAGLALLVGKAQAAVGLMSQSAVDTLQNIYDASKDTTEQLANDTGAAFENSLSTSGSTAAMKFIDNFQAAIGAGTGKLVDAANMVGPAIQGGIDATTQAINWDNFVRGFGIAAQKGQQTMEQLSKNIYQVMVTGTSNLFEKMGEAWQNGTDVFAAFKSAILGMFGDIAIQLGTFYFTMGLANIFLNPAAAAAEIGGGLALMTLGGVLKALGGGGGGGGASPSSPATAVTPSGGVAVNNGANIGGDVTSVSDQNAQPSTQVHVNVQGNILDRRQTGLELADAINDAFGSTGVTFARS